MCVYTSLVSSTRQCFKLFLIYIVFMYTTLSSTTTTTFDMHMAVPPLIITRSSTPLPNSTLLSPPQQQPLILVVPIFPHLDHTLIFSLEHLENDFASYFSHFLSIHQLCEGHSTRVHSPPKPLLDTDLQDLFEFKKSKSV